MTYTHRSPKRRELTGSPKISKVMGDEVKVPGEETTFNYLQPYTILGYVGDNSFMVLTLNP